MQIGTNHFGHFLLGVLLAPALERGARERGRPLAAGQLCPRSATAARACNWDDPHYRTRPYDKWEAYGQSKTANALFAVGFDRRYAGPRRHTPMRSCRAAS